MHSKWKIWDFFHSRESLFKNNEYKVFGFQTFDPFAFRIIKEKYFQSFKEGEKPQTMIGKDITLSWLEDNFCSLGLFGNSQSYLILGADQLSKECKDLLSDPGRLILSDCYLFLDFEKEDELVKKLKKSDLAEVIKIEAPAFWEYDKLLDFVCSVKKVYLTTEAKRLILSKLTPEIGSYFNIITQIEINFPGKMNVNDVDIANLVRNTKIDNFELAELFASKKFKYFYEKVLYLENTEDMRAVFRFMQSHLLKVLDPSFTEKKARLTKYDRQIMSQSSAWQRQSLEKAIEYFSELEFLAKTKNPLIKARLQRDKIRSEIG